MHVRFLTNSGIKLIDIEKISDRQLETICLADMEAEKSAGKDWIADSILPIYGGGSVVVPSYLVEETLDLMLEFEKI